MKKKIYTMVLATLGLFASVDVGAQTWEWKGEEVSGTNPQFYIQNYLTQRFIKNNSTVLAEGIDDACLFTLEGNSNYKLKNANGRYLNWVATGKLETNYESSTFATSFVFSKYSGQDSDSKSGCYRIYYDGLSDAYLYLDGSEATSGLTKGTTSSSRNADHAYWRFISENQKSLSEQYAKFVADTLSADDIKDKAIVTAIKSVASYNYLTYQQASATIRAYRAAAAELEAPVSIPEGFENYAAASSIVNAVAAAKAALDLATTKEAFAAALALKSNAVGILDAVVDAYNTINASVSGNGEAAMAALTTLVNEANETLKGTTDTDEIAKIVADFNDALTLVGDVDILFDNIAMLKKQAEVAFPAETPAANAFAGKIAALNTKANDVADEDGLTALIADIQAAKNYLDHFTTVKNAVEYAQNTEYVESKAKAYETLQASLKEAYDNLLKATKDADLTAVNDAVIAAEAAYNLKAGNVDAVETIKTESFEGNEQLAAFAAEAAEAIQSAATQVEMDAIIANLNNRVMTDVVRGNIDDSKAAEGSDVDINDYAELASIILKATYTRQQKPELSETPDMAERLAVRKYNLCDANEDNKVNVADLTKIVIIIKGQTQSFAKGMNAISGTISTVAAGNDLIFSLANTGMMTGMQLDVTLPAGISIMDQTLSGRAANHSIEVNNIGGNTYRVLINGFDNAAFAEGAGEMFRLSLTGAASSVEVSEAYASDANANSYDLQVAGNSTTGINTVEAQQADAVAIYSIGGKQLNGISKGVNILVGADGKANKVLK